MKRLKLIYSWWVEIQTRGAVPGLSLFEEDSAQPLIETPGIWALGWDEYDAEYDPYVERTGDFHAGNGAGDAGDDDYVDYSGAGSGWMTDDHTDYNDHAHAHDRPTEDLARRRQQARMDIEEAEDLIETLGILGLMGLVGALVAVRARWAERERRERLEREARERFAQLQAQAQAQTQTPGQGTADANVPESVQTPGIQHGLGQRDAPADWTEGVPVGWEPPLQ